MSAEDGGTKCRWVAWGWKSSDLATQQHCLTQSLVKLSEEDLEIAAFQCKLK